MTRDDLTGRISLGKPMKRRYRRIYATQYSLLVLILVAIIGLVFLGWVLLEKIPYEDHFAIPWAAGRAWLLDGESPYADAIGSVADAVLVESTEKAQLPETQTFTGLIFNLFFYLPFSLMPFRISRALWFALSVGIVGLIGYFSLRLSEWKITLFEKVLLIGLVIIGFPGLKAIITGRLTPLIILLLLVGIDALIRGKDTLAGFALALTFGSITISALIVLFLLVWSISRQRWSVLKAYFAGLGFLWVVSLLLLPSWPKDWFRATLSLITTWDWIQTPLMDLSMILPGISHPLSLALHALFAITLITLSISALGKSGLEFLWKSLAIFVIAFLFQLESTIFCLFLVLPALFLVLRFWSERWRLFGRIISWVFLLAVAALTWTFAGPDYSFLQNQSLPILAAGLPIIILAGMVSIRWWAIRLPRLPYEKVRNR